MSDHIKIAPSILSADRKKLQEEVEGIERYSDLLHIDIMDAKFVPPRTFSADEIKDIKTKLPLDVHLMVDYPIKEGYIRDYKGAGIITIHEECKDDIDEAITLIKKGRSKAGISIKPATPLESIRDYLDMVDMVLVMSVEPGYSGQKFIPDVLDKAKELRKIKPGMDIEIDGGINKDTICMAARAGVNIFVAASAIFGQKDRVKAIKELRSAANG